MKCAAMFLMAGAIAGCQCDGENPKGSGPNEGKGSGSEVMSVGQEVERSAGKAVASRQYSDTELAREVISKDLALGGGTLVGPKSVIKANYTIRLPDGTVVLETRPNPVKMDLAEGTLVGAVQAAMVGMRPGGIRRFLVPNHLAYGPNQVGVIPPYSDLDIEVEVVAVIEQ